jgi:hypothetical protein
VSQLAGKAKPSGNLVANADFSAGSTNWTFSPGFSPSFGANNKPLAGFNAGGSTGLGAFLVWGVEDNTIPVQQIINNLPGSDEYEFSFYTKGTENGGSVDQYKAVVQFRNGNNQEVGSLLGQNVLTNVPSTGWFGTGVFSYISFRGSGYASATNAVILVYGNDRGNWAGQYGTQYTLFGLAVPSANKAIPVYGIASQDTSAGSPDSRSGLFYGGSGSIDARFRLGHRTHDGIQYSSLTIDVSSPWYTAPQLRFYFGTNSSRRLPVTGLLILERSDAGGAYYMVNTRWVKDVSILLYDFGTTGS